AASVGLYAGGDLRINGSVNTSSLSGAAGSVSLSGLSVSVLGTSGGASINASSAFGNGADIFIGSRSGALTTGGDIWSYATGARNTAGTIDLVSGGQIVVGNLLAGGLQNANGGSIRLASGNDVTVGTISIRSTSNSDLASLAGY